MNKNFVIMPAIFVVGVISGGIGLTYGLLKSKPVQKMVGEAIGKAAVKSLYPKESSHYGTKTKKN